jgi:hypothetical protein
MTQSTLFVRFLKSKEQMPEGCIDLPSDLRAQAFAASGSCKPGEQAEKRWP